MESVAAEKKVVFLVRDGCLIYSVSLELRSGSYGGEECEL